MKPNLAIVIGIGSYNDLGLIRSCGEANISSIYFIHSQDLVIPIHKSKYVIESKFIVLSSLGDELNRISRSYPLSKILLLGASDAAILEIERLSGTLSSKFIAPKIKGSLHYNMRKDVMASAAIRAGLKVPCTKRIIFEESSISINPGNYPIILKPNNSVEGAKSDIVICHDNDSLLHAIKNLKGKGYREILAQQYLHNSKSKEIGITGVSYGDGNIEIHGLIEKIRNRSNINNFGKYLPNENAPVIESLKEYIRSTGYTGIFDTDFIKYNNEFYFIECNFRNGAYGYCVTSAGFNMCARWAKACGMANVNDCVSKLHNITFMEERTDFLNVLDKTISLSSWIKDFISSDTCLWWNWKDPRPMIRIPFFIKKFLPGRKKEIKKLISSFIGNSPLKTRHLPPPHPPVSH